jgi:PBSX family phage terminase large subunit
MVKMLLERTIPFAPLSKKHRDYILGGIRCRMSVAEGAIRSGKTIDHCIIAALYLESSQDKIHLATGSTIGNAKLNIGVCNGFGLENLFRGRCKWGKFRDNDALFIQTQTGEKIVVFAGGGKADSYKRILGNSYGLWIATEINEHYDSVDSRTSFVKVAMGRQAAAIKPMTLWDLNPSRPNHTIYTNYIDKYRDEQLKGYQYQHFTLEDNLSIDPERREAIKAQYDQNSVWYRRDILGMRCTAEGLIYQSFADNPAAYALDTEQTVLPVLRYVLIGVDFGGNKSSHAFVASGITKDWQLIGLRSQKLDAKGVDTDQLVDAIIRFADKICIDYGFLDGLYCDSAEQTIINSVRNRCKYAVYNSIKNPIVDRIRATALLMATGRLKLVAGQCQSLEDALSSARWDDKEQDDVRLDDGTSDIDSLDAFEYSWEYYIRQLVE